MKKHEIIDYAHKNYPTGTNFLWYDVNPPFISDGNFKFETDLDKTLYLYCNGHTIFNGKKWAEIVTDKKPLLISEDGFELFDGDYHYIASVGTDGVWYYNCSQRLRDYHAVINEPNEFKAFSTKEAAEKWIYEQNKPKEIEIRLFGNKVAKVSLTNIVIDSLTTYNSIAIKPSDIEDISHALKTLNQ